MRKFTKTRAILPWVCSIALLATLLPSADCERGRRTNAQEFPASNEVAGWVKVSEVRVFEAADLWKYIDGEAERYLKFGVKRVKTTDYRFQSMMDTTVDIYIMGDAEGAARVFESEPRGAAGQIQLGDAARMSSQSLVFRKGPYLTRIVAFQDSADVPPALMALAKNIEPRLKN